MMGGKTHVGVGSIPISAAVQGINAANTVKINLVHMKSKSETLDKGILSFDCTLKLLETKPAINKPVVEQGAAIVPLPVGNYRLLVTDIEVNDLYNAGNMFDKQDPCVEITFGNQKLQTAR